MVDESVMLPLLPMTEAFEPKLTGPAYTAAVLLEFVIAPPSEIPEPFKVKGLTIVMVVPFKSNAAPVLTVTAPNLLPNAAPLATFKVPTAIVVPPE